MMENKGTLLIVDDTPDNVKVLLSVLSHEGFKVLVAQDGEQGLETIEYVRPDLILLDIMMPGLNGFEVCQILKEREETRYIPIIFMTALTDTADKVRGFELGAADYITKPIQHEEVLARVNTHLKLYRLQRQLTIKNAKLHQHTMELDAFAHTVAHDLKNPLNAIINLTKIVLNTSKIDQPITPKLLERLGVVSQAGEQMHNIIDALLLLAGVSNKKVETTQVDMLEIIDKILANRLNYFVKKYNTEIICSDNFVSAKGYAPWIEEIWANYITNACKYGGEPPRIELGCELLNDDKQNKVKYWVKDNGQGLTVEAQAKLFTPFTRLHTGRAEGYGLGLSIVQQIVEKLEGKAGVESEIGQGSLFYFILPYE